MHGRFLTISACLLVAGTLAGCGETKPSRFYLLAPVAETTQTADPSRNTASDFTLGVGPVELPKYLDRLQIVSFPTANRVDISEFDRWAEPLNDNFARVLGENLSTMVPTARIDVYPFVSAAPRAFDQQVLVDVTQFRLDPRNRVELRANWKVIEPDRRRSLADGAFAVSEPVSPGDFESVVAAMSRAVGALSRDIAAAIKNLPKGS
jgi:uncharacterized lipoprotein YmbA